MAGGASTSAPQYGDIILVADFLDPQGRNPKGSSLRRDLRSKNTTFRGNATRRRDFHKVGKPSPTGVY